MKKQPCKFERLLLAERQGMFNYAMSLCRNRDKAEDLVQQALMQAWAARDRFKEDTNLGAWLTTIVRNANYNMLRKGKHFVEDPDDTLAHTRLWCRDDPCDRMIAREALEIIATLDYQHREPLLLVAEGARYDEVAAELNMHIGTVKSRVSRVRRLLEVTL